MRPVVTGGHLVVEAALDEAADAVVDERRRQLALVEVLALRDQRPEHPVDLLDDLRVDRVARLHQEHHLPRSQGHNHHGVKGSITGVDHTRPSTG